MNIQTEKIELVKRLLDTDDESVIRQVKDIFESHEKDFWNDLPEHVKAGIEKSRKQADAGLLTQHEDVIKKYTKYL
ncbi:MAG TPA: hypothetical protein VK671_13385 [Mucilaginibacter sp.]|jgi:hypothetical protein|nr:hypothetical protein [Mucilaginibacter sp.]